ncbi:MAG: hypothetical protein GXP29_11720 [Planctomycetes bacterium]|nr:hypothetical protein [Planctomycetota bacterium]
MERYKPTEEDGRLSLRGHVVDKAHAARMRHLGESNRGHIDSEMMLRMLDDGELVRYPTGIRFDAEPLQAGEFAYPQPIGDTPSQGYCIFIHPIFENEREHWPLLIAYHIPSINYGDIVGHEDAELFGATLLGMETEDYYEAICRLADTLPAPPE